jgi:hypothetical protein
MGFALVVIPDAPTLPGKHGADRQQPRHLPRLEDAALWINERDAVALKTKASGEIV